MLHGGTSCGDRSLFSHSLALLSLGLLFFGGCPELVDCLGATDASKSGSSWPSLSPPPSVSPPTFSSLVPQGSLMTMVLSPVVTQVLSYSFSPEVPQMFDLSISSSRAESKCMSSRFFYFSPVDVLKLVKNKFSIFTHNKRLVEKSTLQNLMRQTSGRFFDTHHFYHKIHYLQQICNIFT